MSAVLDLTPDLVNQMLERSRLEIESKLAEAGPLAVVTLVDVMQDPDAKNADRISAASKVLDKVHASPKAEQAEANRGPTLHITINRLSSGQRDEIPIPVSEDVMDAIEAGLVRTDAR